MNKLTADKCREMFLNLFEGKRQDGITLKEDLYLQALEIALPILEKQERGDGWIEWGGGEQPVNGDVMVETKWSDGSVSCGEASEWRCDHRSLLSNLNIIAYRIIPEQPTNQNGEQ
ncbi:hypothetical protein LZU96_21435 (plasmid) [Pantoea agglomerans]|uniref:hypothetical protein n=1 Tax=Enterobacter agglomerans TaxID=549 RepID=UPI001F2887C6|nr:hypothetical protein [Pantoea agglomerans]UIL54712.1 hypothetical protein LZU96_21435 [Pantoea agglomerans]